LNQIYGCSTALAKAFAIIPLPKKQTNMLIQT